MDSRLLIAERQEYFRRQGLTGVANNANVDLKRWGPNSWLFIDNLKNKLGRFRWWLLPVPNAVENNVALILASACHRFCCSDFRPPCLGLVSDLAANQTQKWSDCPSKNLLKSGFWFLADIHSARHHSFSYLVYSVSSLLTSVASWLVELLELYPLQQKLIRVWDGRATCMND